MQAAEVEQLILDQIDDIKVTVETDGSHYQVTAIGNIFSNLNAVKRQQLIYGCLNQHIINGTIHAVIIKTYTPDEWSAIA